MSVRNGKLTRRAGLVMGGAAFLTTVALTASYADASATLALKPTSYPTGSMVTGSATTGYTLTLPAGSPQTFTYDVVTTITGTTPSVSRIQGAVVTSGSATGSHVAYTLGATYDETLSSVTYTNAAKGHTDAIFKLTSNSTTGQAFGTSYSFKPGFLQDVANDAGGPAKGVGPYAATYSSLINTGGASTSNGRVDVTYATPVAGATLDAMYATVTLTGTTAQSTSINWKDGTGATGTNVGAGTVYQSVLEWSENGSNYFSGVSGTYTQFGLKVLFAGTTAYPGDANGDGSVNILDFGILSNNFGQTTSAGSSVGDFNGDGVVDILDFGILSNNFGHTPGGSVSPFVATPEPSSLAFAALGIIPLARRRRVK